MLPKLMLIFMLIKHLIVVTAVLLPCEAPPENKLLSERSDCKETH